MRRGTIGFLAIAFIAMRAFLPNLTFDTVSLVLFGIVCAVLLWPDFTRAAPYVRKLRLGSVELELGEKIKELGRKGEEAQEEQFQGLSAPAKKEGLSPEVIERLRGAAVDPRAGLLLLSVEIEAAVRRLATENGITEQKSLVQIISELAHRKVLSQQVVSLFQDFWTVRNRVAHNAEFDIPPNQMYALLDVGFIVLGLLS